MGPHGLILALVLTGFGLREPAGRVAAERKAPIEYRLSLLEPTTRYVEVELTIFGARGREVELAMPAWIPGSYKIRDFARHVYELRAENLDGAPLRVERIDKQTWKVSHERRGFRVRYRVFAGDSSVRSSHIDDGHALLNPSSLLLYVRGQLDRPATVIVEPPADWTAHTALPVRAGDRSSFFATDYDHLVDSPILVGPAVVESFTIDDARFEYVLSAPGGTNGRVDRLAQDAHRVVRTLGRMMGGFPFRRYVFLVQATEHGGGGLEHADSTAMMIRRDAFVDDDAYVRAAELAAHEFFHLWNVKRIHDRSLGPFDYSREVHSRLLWFHEGFTDTVAELAMLRAGLVSPKKHLARLARAWGDHLARPGRNAEPVSQVSFDAWIRHYQPADNHRNVTTSYYDKGALIGVALDLELRLRSAAHGKDGSLEGLFRRLMASHGRTNKGIVLADIVAAAGAEAGEDMAWFFARHVDGTDELELPRLLSAIGVRVREHAPWTNPDGSTTHRDATADRRRRVYAGLELAKSRVTNVIPGSPAVAAGLMIGDRVLAIEGRVVGEDADARFRDHPPGTNVTVVVDRGGRLVSAPLRLEEDPRRLFVFELVARGELDARTKTVRDRWLEVWGESMGTKTERTHPDGRTD